MVLPDDLIGSADRQGAKSRNARHTATINNDPFVQLLSDSIKFQYPMPRDGVAHSVLGVIE